MSKATAIAIPFSVLLVFGLVYASAKFMPINWGGLTYNLPQTVTVIGNSQSQQKNNQATYSVSVSAIDNDKNTAVTQVNTEMNKITQAVKDFGISEADIQTQGVNISQMTDIYRPDVSGKWNASNSITITLRDVAKANDLTNLLSASGATNVYGPNFTMNDEKASETDLLQSAMDDALTKAAAMAQKSGHTLGPVLQVSEGANYGGPIYPVMNMADGKGGGGGASVEPGSTTLSKSVSVTYSLR